MRKYIKTYFILVLYIVFAIGIIVETHTTCNSCESGHCNIEINDTENEHDCQHNTCEISKIDNIDHTDHHCNCTSKEYKIHNNYFGEDKLSISSNISFSFSILHTIFHPEILFQKIAEEHSFYIKIPDRKLFHKFSVYELSSILC